MINVLPRKTIFFITTLFLVLLCLNSEAKEITFHSSVGDLTAEFDDSMFLKSSDTYDHDLAWMSLCMALSTFSGHETETYGVTGAEDGWIEQSRARVILRAYKDMGFEDVRLFHYDCSLNDVEDKVAFSIASRQMSSGDTLVAVMIRGGGYGDEWFSNFNVGTDEDDFHMGFYGAMQDVYSELMTYLDDLYETGKEQSQNGKVKIWTSGYSRGAAVSNLLAGALDDYNPLNREDIFAYTFATPQGVKERVNPHDALYNNIFNIVNPADLVPAVALSEWGFTHYGITRTFDKDAGLQAKIRIRRKFRELTGKSLNVTKNMAFRNSVQAITRLTSDNWPTVSSSVDTQKALQEIMEYLLTRVETENGRWERISVKAFQKIMARRYGDAFIPVMLDMMNYLDHIPEGRLLAYSLSDTISKQSLWVIFTVCGIHGASIEEIHSFLNNLADIENFFSTISAFFGMADENGGILTRSHFPQVYLAWMSLPEKQTFGNKK